MAETDIKVDLVRIMNSDNRQLDGTLIQGDSQVPTSEVIEFVTEASICVTGASIASIEFKAESDGGFGVFSVHRLQNMFNNMTFVDGAALLGPSQLSAVRLFNATGGFAPTGAQGMQRTVMAETDIKVDLVRIMNSDNRQLDGTLM